MFCSIQGTGCDSNASRQAHFQLSLIFSYEDPCIEYLASIYNLLQIWGKKSSIQQIQQIESGYFFAGVFGLEVVSAG